MSSNTSRHARNVSKCFGGNKLRKPRSHFYLFNNNYTTFLIPIEYYQMSFKATNKVHVHPLPACGPIFFCFSFNWYRWLLRPSHNAKCRPRGGLLFGAFNPSKYAYTVALVFVNVPYLDDFRLHYTPFWVST